jgi:hypothetical protein
MSCFLSPLHQLISLYCPNAINQALYLAYFFPTPSQKDFFKKKKKKKNSAIYIESLKQKQKGFNQSSLL